MSSEPFPTVQTEQRRRLLRRQEDHIAQATICSAIGNDPQRCQRWNSREIPFARPTRR